MMNIWSTRSLTKIGQGILGQKFVKHSSGQAHHATKLYWAWWQKFPI